MSRSYNEISVPNIRGRVLLKKTKRHSSKIIRGCDALNSRVDKIMRMKNTLDKNTLGLDFDKKIRHSDAV